MSVIVRPTPSGAALLIAALAAGIAGGLRQELGALLWGAAFLGLGLYAFLAVAAVVFRLRSFLFNPPSFPLSFDGETGFPGTSLTSPWALALPFRLFPGVFLQGEVWALRPGREMRALTPLTSGKTAMVTFETPLRGRYRTRMILHCRDALGLFHASLPVPGEGRLTVYPPSVPPRGGQELPSLGGGGPAEERSLHRTEDLFDLRKYQAGDDPRRIHWKLFAHLEELFIRQGEEEPPPSGEYPVFIDLTRAGRIVPSPNPAEAYLDQLLGRFALWGQEILRRGGTLTLYGSGVPGQFRAGQEEGFLAFLAGLTFQEGAGNEVLPKEARRFYYLVTPFSEGWVSRFQRLQDQDPGRTGYLVMPPSPAAEEPPGSDGLLQRLIFCREEGALSASPARDLLDRLERLHVEAPKAIPRGGIHVL